ncbi:hypothetical protein BT96DRAFT_745930, partial [Gymnopus androsaceus JB14]
KRFILHDPREEQKEGGSTHLDPTLPETPPTNPEKEQELEHLETPSESQNSGPDPEPVETDDVPRESTNTSLLAALTASRSKLDLEVILKNQYKNDSIFKKIIDKPKDFQNFEVSDGLVYLKLRDRKVLCIPKLTINGRNIRECIIDEAHSLLAHLGPKKTMDYLRDHVWCK